MVELASLGILEQDKDIPEWFLSKPIPVPFLLGVMHRFVLMEPPSHAGYSSDFDDSVNRFLALNVVARWDVAPRIFAHYQVYANAGYSNLTINSPTEIWNHIRAEDIFVSSRFRWDKDVYVEIHCVCDWDHEHGVQLVFRRGNILVRVSEQDGHLTHADAFDLPADVNDEVTLSRILSQR